MNKNSVKYYKNPHKFDKKKKKKQGNSPDGINEIQANVKNIINEIYNMHKPLVLKLIIILISFIEVKNLYFFIASIIRTVYSAFVYFNF